jgi:hypothetical protein
MRALQCVTLKHKLVELIHSNYGHAASWFPLSFDLSKHVIEFVG